MAKKLMIFQRNWLNLKFNESFLKCCQSLIKDKCNFSPVLHFHILTKSNGFKTWMNTFFLLQKNEASGNLETSSHHQPPTYPAVWMNALFILAVDDVVFGLFCGPGTRKTHKYFTTNLPGVLWWEHLWCGLEDVFLFLHIFFVCKTYRKKL